MRGMDFPLTVITASLLCSVSTGSGGLFFVGGGILLASVADEGCAGVSFVSPVERGASVVGTFSASPGFGFSVVEGASIHFLAVASDSLSHFVVWLSSGFDVGMFSASVSGGVFVSFFVSVQDRRASTLSACSRPALNAAGEPSYSPPSNRFWKSAFSSSYVFVFWSFSGVAVFGDSLFSGEIG